MSPFLVGPPADVSKRPIRDDQLEMHEIEVGMLVRIVYTHLPDSQSKTVLRVLSTPYVRRNAPLNSWCFDVEDVDGIAKGLRHQVFLADVAMIPYGKDCWNSSNYLVRAELPASFISKDGKS